MVIPKSIIIFITNKCDLDCRHCFVRKSSVELNVKYIKKIINEVRPELVYLTGGEPFLHSQFLEICKLLKKYNCSAKINTNGYNVKDIVNKCRKLKEIGLGFTLQVSLDGLRETHDFIRQCNSFDNALKTLKQASKFCDTEVLTVVNNYNWKELAELNKILRKYNIKQNFELIRGDPLDKNIKLPPLEKAYKIVKRIYQKEYSKPYTKFFQAMYFRSACQAAKNKFISKCVVCEGRHISVVYANGDVALCELVKPIGNIKGNSFL